MIPTHIDGALPAGIHTAAWAEVEARFGFTPRRQFLLGGLREVLTHFADAGCMVVYLGGSFVTAKAAPKDVDVCWVTEGVEIDLVHPMFLDPFGGRQMTLALFGCECFPASAVEADSELTFVQFFQRARDGRPVGVVAVPLESL